MSSASTTREVIVEDRAHHALPDLLRRVAPGASYVVVADENTLDAAGRDVVEILAAAGLEAESMVLPGRPRLKPDAALSDGIAERLVGGKVGISVGSGVINDLVKYAASLAGSPYVSVATAASMDGYAASGAALLDSGFKRTLNCPPPVGIVADIATVAGAPAEMAGWGYGDLAGKMPAGADWILADRLEEEAINPGPFALVQDNLRGWLADPEGVGSGDPAAIRGLIEGLLISGFAMQAHGNSRPASGSDHQFSHLWEMEGLKVAGVPAAHGACVGVGCVSILALYEWLLDQDLAAIDADAAIAAQPAEAALKAEVARSFTAPHLAENAWTETAAKTVSPERLRARLARLNAVWPELRESLRATLVPAATMQDWLRRCGAPAHPADLGIAPAKHAGDYRRARLIRRRYTILDLLADLGWLDRAIAALFAPDGFWGRQMPGEAPRLAAGGA